MREAVRRVVPFVRREQFTAWVADVWTPVLAQQSADGSWPPETFGLSSTQPSFAGKSAEDRTILATAGVLALTPSERLLPYHVRLDLVNPPNPFDLPPEDDPAD